MSRMGKIPTIMTKPNKEKADDVVGKHSAAMKSIKARLFYPVTLYCCIDWSGTQAIFVSFDCKMAKLFVTGSFLVLFLLCDTGSKPCHLTESFCLN